MDLIFKNLIIIIVQLLTKIMLKFWLLYIHLDIQYNSIRHMKILLIQIFSLLIISSVVLAKKDQSQNTKPILQMDEGSHSSLSSLLGKGLSSFFQDKKQQNINLSRQNEAGDSLSNEKQDKSQQEQFINKAVGEIFGGQSLLPYEALLPKRKKSGSSNILNKLLNQVTEQQKPKSHQFNLLDDILLGKKKKYSDSAFRWENPAFKQGKKDRSNQQIFGKKKHVKRTVIVDRQLIHKLLIREISSLKGGEILNLQSHGYKKAILLNIQYLTIQSQIYTIKAKYVKSKNTLEVISLVQNVNPFAVQDQSDSEDNQKSNQSQKIQIQSTINQMNQLLKKENQLSGKDHLQIPQVTENAKPMTPVNTQTKDAQLKTDSQESKPAIKEVQKQQQVQSLKSQIFSNKKEQAVVKQLPLQINKQSSTQIKQKLQPKIQNQSSISIQNETQLQDKKIKEDKQNDKQEDESETESEQEQPESQTQTDKKNSKDNEINKSNSQKPKQNLIEQKTIDSDKENQTIKQYKSQEIIQKSQISNNDSTNFKQNNVAEQSNNSANIISE